MTTALVGYLVEPTAWKRLALICASVPLAVVLNGARVALTGIVVSRFGLAAAEGFVHTLTGWIVFVCALGSVWAVHRALGGPTSGRPVFGVS